MICSKGLAIFCSRHFYFFARLLSVVILNSKLPLKVDHAAAMISEMKPKYLNLTLVAACFTCYVAVFYKWCTHFKSQSIIFFQLQEVKILNVINIQLTALIMSVFV